MVRTAPQQLQDSENKSSIAGFTAQSQRHYKITQKTRDDKELTYSIGTSQIRPSLFASSTHSKKGKKINKKSGKSFTCIKHQKHRNLKYAAVQDKN